MADLSTKLNTPIEDEKKKNKYPTIRDRLAEATPEDVINEMQRISNDQTFQRKPYEANPQYEQERGTAKDAYKEKQDRARTAEVISHLADAFSRFGAAAYGQNTGTDMSRTQFARPGSFEGTRDRNLSEYMQSLKEIGDKEGIEKERLREEAAAGKEDFGRKQDTLQEALRKKMRDRELGKEDNRIATRDRKESQEKDDLLYREQRKDVGFQGKSLAERERATNQLTDELLREDLKSKDKEKIAAKLGPLAAKAGVDLNAAIEATDKLKDEQPGFFGKLVGKKGKDATELKKNLFDSLKGDLDALKSKQAAREKRLRFSTKPMSLEEEEALNGTQPTSPETQSSATVVKVQGPSGQIAEMTREAAAKYLGKPGYKEVK